MDEEFHYYMHFSHTPITDTPLVTSDCARTHSNGFSGWKNGRTFFQASGKISRHSREGGNPLFSIGPRMKETFYVYMLSSKTRGTLYIGVTTNLTKRVYERKNGLVDGFTKKYGVDQLVYYEIFQDSMTALSRERQMKKWNRAWKIKLIEEQNPEWEDLYERIVS